MFVLSFDDFIEEKQYTDSSELVCWHCDHVFKRSVKGVCFLTVLIEVRCMRLPCAYSWFSSVENMQALKGKLNLNFLFALKSNRKVALSKADKQDKAYINIESLQPGQQTVEV